MKFLKKHKYKILSIIFVAAIAILSYYQDQLAWYWIALISTVIGAILVIMAVAFWLDLIESWG